MKLEIWKGTLTCNANSHTQKQQKVIKHLVRIFLSLIQLPGIQLWAIIMETAPASLTHVNNLCVCSFLMRSLGTSKWSWVPEPTWIPSPTLIWDPSDSFRIPKPARPLSPRVSAIQFKWQFFSFSSKWLWFYILLAQTGFIFYWS